MGVKVTNNAASVLAGPVTNLATSLVVSASTGSKFPALGAGDWFWATLSNAAGQTEVVKVTARAGDSLTIVRGQDNTSAYTFSAGDPIECRPVAALFNDKADAKFTPTGGIEAGTLLGAVLELDAKKLSADSVHASTVKNDIAPEDEFPIWDSVPQILKKVTIAGLYAAIMSVFGQKITTLPEKLTPVDGDTLVLSDSEDAGTTRKLSFGSLKSILTGSLASLAGASFTGNVHVKTLTETKVDVTINTNVLTLDLSQATVFAVNLTSAITTIFLNNPPASPKVYGFTLVLTMDGTARAVTWPASVKWSANIPPELSSAAGKKDFVSFYTDDGGTSYSAFMGGQEL